MHTHLWERACSRWGQTSQRKSLPIGTLSAIIPAPLIREIVMRRLLCLLLFVFALPAGAAGLFDSKPSATLGSVTTAPISCRCAKPFN